TGTGAISSYDNRWTIGTSTYSGSTYISLFFHTVSGGSSYLYHWISAPVTGALLSWPCVGVVGPFAAYDSSGGYVSWVAATDTNGNLVFAYNHLIAWNHDYRSEVFKNTGRLDH